MKHINLSNFKGSITDWTELNYIKGGLVDEYADIANIKGNYVKKSENLIVIPDVAETTTNGITYKVENGVIYLSGSASANTTLTIATNISISADTYYLKRFDNGNVSSPSTPTISFSNGTNNLLTRPSSLDATGYLPSGTYSITSYIRNGVSFTGTFTIKPMLVKGSTAPTEYQPGSTTGLYIEDNVNNELIPINDSNENRVTLQTVAMIIASKMIEDESPTDNEDVNE